MTLSRLIAEFTLIIYIQLAAIYVMLQFYNLQLLYYNMFHKLCHLNYLCLRAGSVYYLGGRESVKCDHQLSDHPCGNFSDTSSLKLQKTKGWIGHAFTVCIHTENQNQVSFYPFVLHEISVLIELTLGHLRYHLTDVRPQPNSRPDSVFGTDRPANESLMSESEP